MRRKQLKTLAHLQSQLRDFGPTPLIIESAKGLYLYDTTGKRYLDAVSGYWLACLGYGDEEIGRILASASNHLSFWHQFGTSHLPALEYVDALWGHLPKELRGKVLFANSGSGAMEIALRVACARDQLQSRQTIIVHLDRSFHGSTFLTEQMSRWNDWPSSLRLPPERIVRIKSPVTRSSASDAIAQFERALRAKPAPTILLTEPVQGAGGIIVPPDGFMENLGNLCRKNGVTWISDETCTSFGSTGCLFALQRWGIVPDIMVVGKKMAAGYFPIAAAIVSKSVSKEILDERSFHFGHTTSGHPVGCMVARAVLARVSDPKLLGNVRERGEQLMQGLAGLQKKHPAARAVRGLGLMVSLELPRSSLATRVAMKLRELGIYESPEGRFLAFCPSFIISPEEVEILLSGVDQALAYCT